MSKFSRLASGQPAALTPGYSQGAPPPIPPHPSSGPQAQSYSPAPYPQGPSIPPRPGASPQPGYQPPAWPGQQQQPPPSSYQGQPQYGQQPLYEVVPPRSPQPGYPQQPQQQQQQYPGQQQYPSYGQQSQYGQQQPQYGQQQQQSQQYGQPQQSPYGQPGQPGQQQYGQGPPPAQQQYGHGPPPGQQQYGQGPPPPQGSANIGAYKNLLQGCIQEKGLQPFYPPGSPQLDQIANRAASQVQQLAQQWKINPEIAQDIVKLALYDVILYVDDSGSMAFEENGERIDDLKLIINRVAFAAGLFDDDGIQVRFMNSQEQGNGIRHQQQVEELIGRIRFQGLTPMGRELQNKVLQPLILGAARSGQLRKPVLVIIITDGQPTGESSKDISNIITSASRELSGNPRCGRGAVAFQFAQVGNDIKAREFLKLLDEDKQIGDLIDCTSNFEVEQDEMMRAVPPVNLTPELWLIKLLLGSIDSSYDKQDESTSAPPQGSYGGPPQQGGYGGPPPGQYGGPPQGQYGGPPQNQYGAPPQGRGGPPPPGQYGGPGGPGGYPGGPPRY